VVWSSQSALNHSHGGAQLAVATDSVYFASSMQPYTDGKVLIRFLNLSTQWHTIQGESDPDTGVL